MNNARINKYIGARYVPLFCGEWEKDKEYEPLSIVVFEGASFTSKTYVPKGVEIMSTKFWTCTGNYNAQIEQYRKDVVNYKKQLLNEFNTRLENTPNCDNSNILYVAKEKGAQFNTINSAIEYAKTYASSDNRVVIYIASGLYNEEINLLNNCGIDLVGVSPTSTIIRYGSKYPNSPLFTTGQGTFTNICFQCYQGDSYALHVENQVDNSKGEINFNNCHFISYDSNAIGLGLGEGLNVIFNNCAFNTTKEGAKAVYLHNNPSNVSSAIARFINCQIYGDLQIDDAAAIYNNNVNSILSLTFINNWITGKLVYKKKENELYSYIPIDDNHIKLDNLSYGNNCSSVNGYESGYTMLNVVTVPSIVPSTDYRKISIPLADALHKEIEVTNAVVDGVKVLDVDSVVVAEKYSNCFVINLKCSDDIDGKSMTVCYKCMPV